MPAVLAKFNDTRLRFGLDTGAAFLGAVDGLPGFVEAAEMVGKLSIKG